MTAEGQLKLFVYGTLMAGEASHHLLGDAQLIGTVQTASRYDLVKVDWYPGLLAGDKAVWGEIYSIRQTFLSELDQYEGHPDHFTRTQIELSSGEMVIGYIFNALVGDRYPAIIHGDWRKRNETVGSD